MQRLQDETYYQKDEIYYQIALSFVQGIGAKRAATLIAAFGSAKEVLSAPLRQLVAVEGMTELKAKALKDSSIYPLADKEMTFIAAKKIRVLLQADPDFPSRLLHCTDAPQFLYYSGTANLNKPKTIAVIGTRKYTDYGQRVTSDLIQGLASLDDVLIVSGLAHGIDTIAHKEALRHNLPTVGVLGHGLNMIYPVANKGLAREMQEKGGLLTEFSSSSIPDKGNFPARNRIVAGLCDVTVVAESDLSGGALITAYMANSYNREVAAFPGRAYDAKSAGTNMLIRKSQAVSICNAGDLLQLMGWQKKKSSKAVQQKLLLHLSVEEQKLMTLLQQKDATHADELLLLSGMGSSQLASALLMLEMQGLIRTLPGKLYRIN